MKFFEALPHIKAGKLFSHNDIDGGELYSLPENGDDDFGLTLDMVVEDDGWNIHDPETFEKLDKDGNKL